MVDLTTTYLDMKLKSPLVASPSPLMENIDHIVEMEDAGAAAVVLNSLYAEQIDAEKLALQYYIESTAHFHPEAADYFPEPDRFHARTDDYLDQIRRARERVDIPVIASLNGSELGDWIDLALEMQKVGASAIELNIYSIPSDINLTGQEVEAQTVEIVQAVCDKVWIPVAVKLSPYYSNFANLAKQLVDAGAGSLVMFNRFYQPDIDLETFEAEPNILLSTPYDLRLPLRWIGILHGRLEVDFAATSGIHEATDIVKMLMVGANVTMMTSAILKHGIGHIHRVTQELERWLEDNQYDSVQQMWGSVSQMNNPDPSVFERAQYIRGLRTYMPDFS